ncbi:DUF4344 domain-containing metallopeptidase [Rhizobium sp. CECT 9324]|uniref:DUF4344 domain-containing metallopeptidase n=1 Tax=Rhizobium sp. CECT 9324 TaxID=2845820 RepID=UPI001E4201D8|nr:DUF4344 domain-containing metallopeptidase [Rhizobium sp. CECT 9324]
MRYFTTALIALGGACAAFFAMPAGSAKADLTPEEITEGRKYVVNNAIFILFHEGGHMLVSELGLPVLGREEDAVDGLSSVMLLESEDEELRAAMQDAADGWFLIDANNAQGVEETDFQGTHGLNKQRAYALVCMMSGKDPEYFKAFIDSLEFPEERREQCVAEYEQTRDSWWGVLDPYVDDTKTSNFTVTYEPAGDDLQYVEDMLKEGQVLEAISATFGEGYNIPDGIKVTAKTCGVINAFWDPAAREITFCYEFAAHHADLVSQYFEENRAPSSPEDQPQADEKRGMISALKAAASDP